MGDRDGVLVVPRAVAIEIADPAFEQEQIEAFVSKKIHLLVSRCGATTHPARTPSPNTRRRCARKRSRTAVDASARTAEGCGAALPGFVGSGGGE